MLKENNSSQETSTSVRLIDDKSNEHKALNVEHEDDSSLMHFHGSCLRRWLGPIRSGSLRGSTIAIASITFGGGCLAFPCAVMHTGPIIAFIIFALVGLSSLYTEWILLAAGMDTHNMDYNSLIEKEMGHKWNIFYDINNIILCLGVIMSYQISVYGFALDTLNFFYSSFDEKSQYNKILIMLVCFILIQIPLSLLKNVSTLQYASIAGTVALLYSILVIVVEMPFYFSNYLKEGNTVPLFKPISWNYLDTFSTFMFGFAAHNGIFQVFHELKRPTEERYHKILLRSFILEIALYLSISYGGYFSTFEKTKGVFLLREDLPGFQDYFIKIAKITLFICLHCTMAINYNIMRLSVKSMCFNNQDISFMKDFFITLFTYIFCNLVVFFVEDIVSILGIIGGFSTVVICFVNPIMIHVISSHKPFTHSSNLFSLILMVFMIVFGSAATIKSVYDIINKLIK
jgi:amino acid permease